MDAAKPLYGLMAEFPDANSLVEAARRTRSEGYTKTDAYSPFPIHDLFDALAIRDNRVQLIVLLGGIAGAFAGFGLCYWVSAIAYPMNIGGRPLNSWPSFIPVTFEVTVLLASFAAMFAWIGLSGLPMPYHPVFNAPRFALASRNRFFLCIEARDPKFDRELTQRFLDSLDPRRVSEVAW
jgi:Protein of unknown function (DUF3341)